MLSLNQNAYFWEISFLQNQLKDYSSLTRFITCLKRYWFQDFYIKIGIISKYLINGILITKTLNLLILTLQFNYYLKVQIFRCLVIFLKLLVFETMNRSFYIISKSSYLCTIKLFHRIIYARVAIGTKKCGYKTEWVQNRAGWGILRYILTIFYLLLK